MVQLLFQTTDFTIHRKDRSVQFLARCRAVIMASGVDGVEIERHQPGPDIRWPPHPVNYRIDPPIIGQILAKRPPVRRTDAVEIHFRSRPEHGGGTDALFLGADPDRLCLVPPERILGCHLEDLARPCGIFHGVADYAVMIGCFPSNQRPVIGEGLAREGRAHRTVDAGRCQCLQIGGDPPFQIVWTEAVDRDQDRDRIAGFCLFADRLILLGRGCGQRGRGGQ